MLNGRFDPSDHRNTAVTDLWLRGWWNATDASVRSRILDLPGGWDGFMADLADRPEVVGGVTQGRIVQFLDTDFGAIIQFEVVAGENVYRYMYFSWRHGANSGQKGLVLVRTNGKITHLVMLRGQKFATHQDGWDAIGGFADVTSVPENILKEIREELGVVDIEVAEVHDLGSFWTDPGMTNNRPGSFVAVIEAHDAARIAEGGKNLDHYELESGPVVLLIEQLPELLMRSDTDSFLAVAAVRAVVTGILPASVLVPSA